MKWFIVPQTPVAAPDALIHLNHVQFSDQGVYIQFNENEPYRYFIIQDTICSDSGDEHSDSDSDSDSGDEQ